MKQIAAIFLFLAFLTVSGQKNWQPGNYLLAANRTTQQDFLKGNFIGVQKKYWWKDIEKAEGVYDFSEIRSDLEFLAKNHKFLVIQIQNKSFEKEDFGGPKYLQQEKYSGGFYRTAVNSWNPVYWNPKVSERIIALYRALGNEFNKAANLEAVVLAETAP